MSIRTEGSFTVAWLVATLAFLLPGPAAAQRALPPSLTLDEAIRLAKHNNPSFLATSNDEDVARWDVRSAYGALLPSVSVGSSLSWQGPGEQRFGSITTSQLGYGDQPSYYFSSYDLAVSFSLSRAQWLAPGQAKATRDATTAQIRSAEATLVLTVTQRYLDVLRQEEGLRLAEQELSRSQFSLRLAEGRLTVGSVTPLDVHAAEVEVGRARILLLQAENFVHSSRLNLVQQLGFDPQAGPVLSTTFELVDPPWTEGELTDLALKRSPSLSALRANEKAAGYQVKVANSSYFPTLSLSTGISGFTSQPSDAGYFVRQAEAQYRAQKQSCELQNTYLEALDLPTQDCSNIMLTNRDRRAILNSYDAFPFDFTRNPPSASLSISFPVFQGFGRQRSVEAAKAQRKDARLQVRERELALRVEIGSGLALVQTAFQTAVLEENNQQLAEKQLRLAQEQYRLDP